MSEPILNFKKIHDPYHAKHFTLRHGTSLPNLTNRLWLFKCRMPLPRGNDIFFFLRVNCFKFIFILFCIYYLFLAVLGFHFCARAFSSCGKRGPLLIAVRGPLTMAASLVAEHRLQMRRLSSCGSRA